MDDYSRNRSENNVGLNAGKAESPMMQALDNQEKRLESLTISVETLRNALRPLLLETPTNKEIGVGVDGEVKAESQYVAAVNGFARRTARIEQEIQHILRHIEI